MSGIMPVITIAVRSARSAHNASAVTRWSVRPDPHVTAQAWRHTFTCIPAGIKRSANRRVGER
jgi:hypothetical protein